MFHQFMRVVNHTNVKYIMLIFTQKAHLKAHITSVHEGNKPFECEACEARFAQKGTLHRHVESIHKQNKPFKSVRQKLKTCS